MKKFLFSVVITMVASVAVAQETYENAKLIDNDLNGTSRYVGMGGAMDALGADLSVISTNPAGIGLFRHSSITGSFGLQMQSDTESYAIGNKNNASFDQIGFVWSSVGGKKSYVNFAFNYHKSKNFNYILSAAGNPQNASQNQLSYMKGLANSQDNGGFNIDKDKDGTYIGYVNETSDYTALTFNQLDYLYWNAFIVDQNGNYGYNNAQYLQFNREHTGYIGAYDMNISGNVRDRIFWGVTFGFRDVHYNGYTTYKEELSDVNSGYIGDVTVKDDRRITGSGFNITGGLIFRPIETSPFRIGLAVTTPTWYDLTTENVTRLDNGTPYGLYDNARISNAYDFKLYTPWKFGLSLGHTIGNYLALGAVWEYADYSQMDTRVNDGVNYSWYYDDYYETSSSDREMNNHTKQTLKGVSTLKLGVEAKPIPELSLRAGYNYLSPLYKKEGYKDGGLISYGSSYSSATDYTNWEATNRFTLGLGLNLDKFNIDLAWQYSSTNGTFYPYTSYEMTYVDENNQTQNIAMSEDKFKVSNKRMQLLLSIGYHF